MKFETVSLFEIALLIDEFVLYIKFLYRQDQKNKMKLYQLSLYWKASSDEAVLYRCTSCAKL